MRPLDDERQKWLTSFAPAADSEDSLSSDFTGIKSP